MDWNQYASDMIARNIFRMVSFIRLFSALVICSLCLSRHLNLSYLKSFHKAEDNLASADICIYVAYRRGQTAEPIGLIFLWTLKDMAGGCYRLENFKIFLLTFFPRATPGHSDKSGIDNNLINHIQRRVLTTALTIKLHTKYILFYIDILFVGKISSFSNILNIIDKIICICMKKLPFNISYN